jgi:hypothetical protein
MQRSKVLVAVGALAVVGWWVLGFLPWLVSGLQVSAVAGRLGGSGEGTSGLLMPLPLVAQTLPELVACGLVAGTVAGLLPILVTHVPRPVVVIEVWLVVLVTAVLACLVSARRIQQAAAGLFAADSRVLTGLCAAFLAALVLGLLAGTVAVHWHGLAAVAAALVAGTMRVWVAAFVPPGRLDAETIARIAAVLLAVILGAGLVVSVHRSRAWLLAWPVALATLWITGPALTAVGYLTALLRPSSGLPASLPEHLRAARQVFGQAIGHTRPSLLAVGLALLAGVISAVQHHRRAGSGTGSLKT